MRFARVLALVVIAALLAVGTIVDLRDRPLPGLLVQPDPSLNVASGPAVTWFCPGGSGSTGVAALTIELISASPVTRTATVTVIPDGLIVTQEATINSGGSSRRFSKVIVPPGERVVLSPAEKAPDARWVGAVVEVDGSDVVVEQVVDDRRSGVGRSTCLTHTAQRWVVPHGATRLETEGERFVVMLLNPFHDFAVADVEMIADVGRDSIEGLVIPAGSVVAVNVTDEITVAESVLVLIEAVSGRLAVSWIQLTDSSTSGRGARIATAIPVPAELWYLPSVAVGSSRSDLIAIANPSTDRTAAVDLSVIADSPSVVVNPIELEVPPGRTTLVDLGAQERQERLADLDTFTVVARSLDGTPIAVSAVSVVGDGANDALGAAVHTVPGTTAMTAADAAAKRWLVPVEVAAGANNSTTGFDYDASNVAIVNPSVVGIALVDIIVNGDTVQSIELGPQRRAWLPLHRFGMGRFVLEVSSSSPVIAARELVGLTSRTASLGVATSEPVLLSDLR